ncbi:hypothetical protein pb186bvf_003542 [Paramecium bursaria]
MSFKFQFTEDLQARIKAKKEKKHVEQIDHPQQEEIKQIDQKQPSKLKDVKNERELRSKPKIQIQPFTPEQLLIPSFPVPGMITFEQGTIPIEERYITFYKTIHHNQMLMIKAQHSNDRMACSILDDYQEDINKFLEKELELKRMQRSFHDIDVEEIEILDLRQKNRIYYQQIEVMNEASSYFENFFDNNPEVVDEIMKKIFRAIPKPQEFQQNLEEKLHDELKVIKKEIKTIRKSFYSDVEDEMTSLQHKLGILEELLRKYDQKIKQYRQRIAKYVGGLDNLLIY